jgi:hypothetical protein
VFLYEWVLQKFQKTTKNIFMNKNYKLFSVALISTVLSVPAFAALSGTYQIGASGDYKSFGAAVKALETEGVNGAVTFLVEKGDYSEKLTIGSVKGASANSTISFESKSRANTDVVLESVSASSDYVLTIKDASFITFENITFDNTASAYGNTVRLEGNLSHISFKGDVFNGVEGARTGANNAVVTESPDGKKFAIAFDDCEFNNGSYGLYRSINSEGSNGIRTTVSGSLFFNQNESGIALANEDAPNISNNVISSLSTFPEFKAVSLEACANGLIVSNNIINAANGRYGIFMNNCTGLANGYGVVNGNSISIGGNAALYGVYVDGTTDNQLINFNRIKLTIDNAQASNQAYYKNNSKGNNINLANNLFYDLNTGGYTIIGNTYKDFFNQLPQNETSLAVSANGITIEKVTPIK